MGKIKMGNSGTTEAKRHIPRSSIEPEIIEIEKVIEVPIEVEKIVEIPKEVSIEQEYDDTHLRILVESQKQELLLKEQQIIERIYELDEAHMQLEKDIKEDMLDVFSELDEYKTLSDKQGSVIVDLRAKDYKKDDEIKLLKKYNKYLAIGILVSIVLSIIL